MKNTGASVSGMRINKLALSVCSNIAEEGVADDVAPVILFSKTCTCLEIYANSSGIAHFSAKSELCD